MSGKTPGQRDRFLDALRAIALVRVATWHAFGEPTITWVITTMPLMFFIAGSLLFGSYERRSTRQVLASRLRRLLVPFWMFGAVVLTFLSIGHLVSPSSRTGWSPEQLMTWAVPVVDPSASEWEAGWASSPLWYLRAYLWILLLSPLLVAAWRRFGFGVAPVGLGALTIAQIAGERLDAGPGHLVWIVGDLGTYGLFVVLGFAHRDGAFDRLQRRDLVEWTLIASAATAVMWQLAPSDDGVINHSYPTLLAAGTGWIAVAFLARPLIDRALDLTVVSSVVAWMTRRAMSIYLWHSPAIVGAYLLIEQLGVDRSPTIVILLTLVLTALAVTATGWIEDIASRRPAQVWPTRRDRSRGRSASAHRGRRVSIASLLAGGATALIITATVLPISEAGGTASAREESAGGVALPPPPSGRPDPAAAATAPGATTETVREVRRPDGSAATEESLASLTEAWRSDTGISGVAMAVALPDGRRFVAELGTDGDGSPMSTETARPITSVTKTMTSAVVLRLVEEGRLELDRPLREIPGVGPIPGGEAVTVRQLLDHSSGLAPYQETATYDAGAALTPEEAVAASLSTPLQWAPGTEPGYSNSGFLALGLLAEAATGRSFDALIDEYVIAPAALAATVLDPTPTAGWTGGSAGGVVSTVDDLATWGEALYRDGRVLSEAMLDQMTTIDERLSSGLGTFPICPCRSSGDGTMTPVSYGHNGGSVTVQYSPAHGVVIAAAFSESFWTMSFDQADVYALLEEVRAHVTG